MTNQEVKNMNEEDVIRLAREAGLATTYRQYSDWIDAGPSGEEIVAFAKLVAEHEREACAKMCEEEKINAVHYSAPTQSNWLAKKIRAR
jgi:hypothetical protein